MLINLRRVRSDWIQIESEDLSMWGKVPFFGGGQFFASPQVIAARKLNYHAALLLEDFAIQCSLCLKCVNTTKRVNVLQSFRIV